MDKVKLNNQVISMRKYVKQAKVRMINKLVKQIKMLQTKNGTDSQLEKYKRKRERLLEEIEVIKKLNVDHVSKAALMQEKNWKDVLESKTSTVQERGFALLANYDAVQVEVKNFHEKYPELASLMPELFKQWEEKNSIPSLKLSKKFKASEWRMKMKERKQKLNPRSVKRKEPTERMRTVPPKYENTFRSQESPRASRVPQESKETHNSSLLSPEMVEKPDTAETGHSTEAFEKNDSNDCIQVQAAEKTHSGLAIRNGTSEMADITHSAQKASKGLKAISVLKLEDLQGQETIPLGQASDSEESCSDEGGDAMDTNLKNDPFFISGSEPLDEEDKRVGVGSEQDSSSSVENRNFRRHGAPVGQRFKKDGFHFSGKKQPNLRTNSQRGRKRFPPSRETSNRPFRQIKGPRESNKTGNLPQQKFSRFSGGIRNKFRSPKSGEMKSKQMSEDSGASLHPSWEAKRKLKMKEMKIAPFQGKKIKFDD